MLCWKTDQPQDLFLRAHLCLFVSQLPTSLT
jgi:hypothetical protein